MDENSTKENQSENAIRLEIQNTLIAINDVTIKIKRELDFINQLASKKGELESTLTEAKVSLTKKIEQELINVSDVLKNVQKDRLEGDKGNLSAEEMTQRIAMLMQGEKS